MANSTKTSLLVCTFQTLLKFLNWIPLGYIFETQLVKTLVYKFLPQVPYRARHPAFPSFARLLIRGGRVIP